ncbi:hypothetical protein ACHAPO_006537 [Fusarium lateritium]
MTTTATLTPWNTPPSALSLLLSRRTCLDDVKPLHTVEEHRPGLYVGIFPEQAAQVTPDEQVINHWSSIPVFFRTARCPGEQILQQIRGLNANKYCLDTNVVAEAEAFDSMYPVPGRNG